MLQGDALLWGDTTQANLKRYVERYFLTALRRAKIPYEWNSTDKVLKVGTGFTDFRSAERPENWEGFGYKRVFLNEAGIILADRNLYENTVLPMMIDFPDSQLIAAGVPKGHNAFWEMFQRAMNGEPGYYTPASHMPPKPGQTHFAYTWEDNPWLDQETARKIFSSVSEQNRLEVELGQFLSDGGGVFRNVELTHTSTPTEPEYIVTKIKGVETRTIKQYAFGVDWGKQNDFTVISVWDIAEGREVYLDRFNQIDYQFQLGRLRALYDRYKPIIIVAEENSMGGPLVDAIRRAGLPVRPFTTTNATKADVIQDLSLAMERQIVTLINDPVARAEMLVFQMSRTQTGLSRYSAPEGMHDDTVMARALGYYALSNRAPTIQEQRKFAMV